MTCRFKCHADSLYCHVIPPYVPVQQKSPKFNVFSILIDLKQLTLFLQERFIKITVNMGVCGRHLSGSPYWLAYTHICSVT